MLLYNGFSMWLDSLAKYARPSLKNVDNWMRTYAVLKPSALTRLFQMRKLPMPSTNAPLYHQRSRLLDGALITKWLDPLLFSKKKNMLFEQFPL